MSDKSFFERVKEEVSDPWDWVALGIGGAGGLAVSIFAHGADAGTSASAGALGAVTLRKAAVASVQKRSLLKRARKLLARMDQDSQDALRRDIALLEEKIVTPAQFSALLDEHIERYRGR